jgi:hypothetical protein
MHFKTILDSQVPCRPTEFRQRKISKAKTFLKSFT